MHGCQLYWAIKLHAHWDCDCWFWLPGWSSSSSYVSQWVDIWDILTYPLSCRGRVKQWVQWTVPGKAGQHSWCHHSNHIYTISKGQRRQVVWRRSKRGHLFWLWTAIIGHTVDSLWLSERSQKYRYELFYVFVHEIHLWIYSSCISTHFFGHSHI